MPFSNPIVGGGFLVIPSIESPNYVAGVSGWRIARDGSVEFNNGTFRGSIEVGSLTGQHFWVNNPSTGDVVDVYNPSNQLVTVIDASGNVTTLDPSTDDTATLFSNGLHWKNTLRPPSGQPRIYGQGDGTNGNAITLATDLSGATGGFAELQLFDSVANAGGPSSVMAYQRDTAATPGLLGTVVQTDGYGTGNYNFLHTGVYSGTVAGGDGHWVFAHNCGFTPAGVVLTAYAAGGGDGPGYVRMWTNAVDSTSCYTIWTNDGGGRTANGTTVGVHAIFFG